MTEDRDTPLKVAMIVADEREAQGRYHLPDPYFGPAPTSLLEGLEKLPELEVHLVCAVRAPVAAPAQIGRNLFYHAIQVPRWAFLKTLYLPAILQIRRRLWKLHPAVVHGQGTERFYGLAAALSGFPSVVTIHGNMRAVARALHARPLSFYGVTARLEAVALRAASGVICLSSHAEREVEGLAKRRWVLPNAVPEVYFGIQPRPAEMPQFLCVGLVCPYKNQNALIRALDAIAGRMAFKLVFAGPISEGEYGREFRDLISSRAWCEYAGTLSQSELRERLATARCLIHPSLEDNCPMVILEAMAAGLPVISSQCGGIPDFVETGVTGYQCPVESMQTFADAAAALIGKPSKADEFGRNAREQASERFLPQAIARRHLEIYRELAAGAVPGSP